jgi:UDP-N-acetylmuramyl tripeptide synthase
LAKRAKTCYDDRTMAVETRRTWRTVAAVWAARLTAWVMRRLGQGGSSLPGLIARRIDGRVLERLAARFRDGVLLVTGTNGKTTTTALAADALEAGGWTLVRNQSGANLLAGLTAALVNGVDLALRPRGTLALLETDEATLPRAATAVHPRLVAVTNFFRDQLDRYGELSHTVNLVRVGIQALPDTGIAVLNADDPHVAWLAADAPLTWFYGVEVDVPQDGIGDAGDARFCPRCGQELSYRRRTYAHLGEYRCPGCGFERPTPAVTVVAVDGSLDGRRLLIAYPEGTFSVPLHLPGTYNVYNAVAAATVALALGVSPAAIAAGMGESRAAFGRMEALDWRGREIRLALVKNPTGFNQVLAAVADDPRPKDILVVINDRYADGRDVSWLWDVAFEDLAPRVSAERWWVAGQRAWDMAVRLKYAGVAPERVTRVDEHPGAALDQVVGASDRPLYVLPTYTAMLEVRRRLWQAGVVAHFREG